MTGQESKAKLIAETILEVRSGRISAKKGSEKLQMSRKSYYKWEKRALGGMLDALAQRPSGRPELPAEDPEKLAMRKELEQLKGENLKLQKQLELRIIVQKMLTDDLEDKKKRNEIAVEKVELVRQMKSEHSVPYATGVAMAEVSYPTFMRWNIRYESGCELVSVPGPRKIERLELDDLKSDVFRLGFGPKRTSGTGELHRKYQHQISRRNLDMMISEARRESIDERLESMKRITWEIPRSVWSMDVTEAKVNGGTAFVNLLQDMSSKYKLHSIAGYGEPCGEEVAGQLEHAFRKNGPPLFLKRDNGGNLNHAAVQDVLERYMVVPFNSPPYYPKFNGSVENANCELKKEESFALVRELEAYRGNELSLYTDNVLNCLNHKERGILKGKCSCLSFFGSEKLNVTRRDRKEIYEWIVERKLEIKEELGHGIKDEKAIRLAIETWLLMNGHITVARNGEVLPYLQGQNLS